MLNNLNKYKHIRNIILALMAAFAAVVLFIILLPYMIMLLMIVVAAVIAWQLGTYTFACVWLQLRTMRY